MNEQKKISVKKTMRAIAGMLFAILFLITLIAASRQQNSKMINGLEITLNDENDYSFLETKDIEQMLLTNRNINLKSTAIAQMNLRQMKAVAQTHPWVAKADVFIDNRHILKINIVQREPTARIFDRNGSSYYMDSLLNVMPVSTGYAFPAPVFTNVLVYKNDSMNTAMKAKIAYISRVIGKDSFWNAQITQVEVQDEQNFLLIPLIGNQTILLGDTNNIKNKLENLLAFYKNIPPKIGWDKYEILDIRFARQIVASPSIGWTPPKVTDTVVTEAITPAPKVTEVKTAITPETPVARKNESKTAIGIDKQANMKTNKKEDISIPNHKKKIKQETKKEAPTKSPKYIYTGNNSGNH